MSHHIPASDWTRQMNASALSEGWCLSERDDGYFEIQRYDDDPDQRFCCDQDAIQHVAEQARGGSYLHQLALHFDGTLWGDT